MSVAVCMLACDRKIDDVYSLARCMDLQGDYTLYLNFQHEPEQTEALETMRRICQSAINEGNNRQKSFSVDCWGWNTILGDAWRGLPTFDQDQKRLAGIVTARNMCIEYAMQTNASHLLFCDADIIPPHDIIPKLLAVFDKVPTEAVGGLVHGRGTHSNLRYVFGQKREVSLDGYTLLELEHSNIGFTMLTSRAFNQIRFRYGVSEYPDGRNHMISDDPAYHLDAFKKFGTWMYVRTDVLGRHVGDLQPHQTAQF